MNPEIFAEWLRRQGHTVVRTTSSYWYDKSSRVYQAFPYHWTIEPTEEELIGLLQKKRAVALRYSTPVNYSPGCISYHAVYDKPTYTLEALDRRSRQNIRKGLKNCNVEPISIERYATDGWLLEKDTLARQGRWTRQSEKTWHRNCMAAADLAGFEIWGALVGDRIAATLLTFQMEDCCELIFQQCHRDYLNARVNNALTFVVTQTMINRSDVNSIFYALHSLDAPCSVDEFKFRMGYIAKPVRQRVVFHPMVEPLTGSFLHKVTARLLKYYPGSYTFAKAEGMLRFNMQGKCRLNKQDWPGCLIDRKRGIIDASNIQEESKGV